MRYDNITNTIVPAEFRGMALRRAFEKYERSTRDMVRLRCWLRATFRVPDMFILPDGPLSFRWTDNEAETLDADIADKLQAALEDAMQYVVRSVPPPQCPPCLRGEERTSS